MPSSPEWESLRAWRSSLIRSSAFRAGDKGDRLSLPLKTLAGHQLVGLIDRIDFFDRQI
jgi:hypothetical protein